jgi:hypothetical protein
VKGQEHFPKFFTFPHTILVNADEIDGPSTEQFHEKARKRQRCSELQSFACFCTPFQLAFLGIGTPTPLMLLALKRGNNNEHEVSVSGPLTTTAISPDFTHLSLGLSSPPVLIRQPTNVS